MSENKQDDDFKEMNNNLSNKKQEIELTNEELKEIEDFTKTVLNTKEEKLSEVNTENNMEYKITDIDEFIAKNKWRAYEKLMEIYTEKSKEDMQLKKEYSKKLIKILVAQLFVMNIVFMLRGFKVLNFSDATFNLFITATIAEVFTLVTIIVKYLFTDKLSDLLSGIFKNEDKNQEKKDDSVL